jgi:hypothetical protein
MKLTIRFVLIAACVGALIGSASAQDLSRQLSQLAGVNAGRYVSPLLSGWGVGLNSALYHSADLHDVLGFDIGVKATFFPWKDEDKTYDFQMPSTIVAGPVTLVADRDYPGVVKAQSVAGDAKTTSVNTLASAPGGSREILQIPGGVGAAGAGLFVPQVSLGLPFGLEVSARFMPTITIKEVGKVNYLGFGVRYSIDQWIPFCPVDIAVHFMTQKFNFKDSVDNNLISASALAYGAEVSKSLLFLTVYAGFQLENAKFTVGPYDAVFLAAGQPVTAHVDAFDVESPNKSRVTLGVRLLLAVVNVHAEYAIAKTPMFAAGLGITFR